MASNEELKKIKKKYGEKFMHMCRELFPTILEEEGRLLSLLEDTFGNNFKNLYDDIYNNLLDDRFKALIYDKFAPKVVIEPIEGSEPYELLDKAGYTLYECTTEEEIQKFKKYFANDEELCTFKGGRLNYCIVFFAVKKNVDEIKREDFNDPRREDEYGTSVMSIQFTKRGVCVVSIKNRYNHTVRNPDATYGNDLDAIVPGLEKSFETLLEERGLYLNHDNVEKLEIPGYVVASDGKHYKYNMEINGRYYCPENIVVDYGQAIKVGSPEKKILIESFVVDLINKTIAQYGSGFYKDSFTDALKDIERIEVTRDKASANGDRIITIKRKGTDVPIEIRIDKHNCIIGYTNMDLKEVGDSFLLYNKKMQHLSLPMLEKTGINFLGFNSALRKLSLPKLKEVGKGFLFGNRFLEKLELPSLEEAPNDFLRFNEGLRELELPSLKKAGDKFLGKNVRIFSLNLPNLEVIGEAFLVENSKLEELKLPKAKKIGNHFMIMNTQISNFEAPNLEEVGDYFLYGNMELRRIVLPQLISAGNSFLYYNESLEEIDLPRLREIGSVGNAKILAYQSAKPVEASDIAKLDKDSEITESEVTSSRRLLGKIKDFLTKE